MGIAFLNSYCNSNNYKFKIQSTELFSPGTTKDTLKDARIGFPNPETFGSLQGFVKDALNEHNWILYLINSKNERVVRLDSTEFHLKWLKPGTYTFNLLDDIDGNGYWSPGSLNPYTLPEKYYYDSEKIEVKAKWDIEDFEVVPKERIATPDTTAESLSTKGSFSGKQGEKGTLNESQSPAKLKRKN